MPRQRWEYLELFLDNMRWMDSHGRAGMCSEVRSPAFYRRSLAPVMNQLGADGWELMSSFSPDEGKFAFVFKRPLDEDTP